MEYFIMRKNVPITVAEITDDGIMVSYSKNVRNEELAPLHGKTFSDWLNKWWKNRSIPIKQGKVEDMLRTKGLISPEEYLVRNLGLSLTDYYWIKPIDSNLTWEKVNLFDNDFRNDMLSFKDNDLGNSTPQYTPNSSLQGQLEKSWMIQNGERILVKGNRDCYSSESINEVIATKLHELQMHDNYTEYHLIKIKDKEYDYGCYSTAFTSQSLELISAYDVISSEKRQNNISEYEHFINVCAKHGIDREQLRADLEYQIMTDFILSNNDRHLNNISILRDADTLQFVRMAPIYDSGKSLFVDSKLPVNMKELLDIRTNSFISSELSLMKLVTDRELVDVTKMPSVAYINEMYEKDSRMDKMRIALICEWYERKIELFRDFQLGKDLNNRKFCGL